MADRARIYRFSRGAQLTSFPTARNNLTDSSLVSDTHRFQLYTTDNARRKAASQVSTRCETQPRHRKRERNAALNTFVDLGISEIRRDLRSFRIRVIRQPGGEGEEEAASCVPRVRARGKPLAL